MTSLRSISEIFGCALTGLLLCASGTLGGERTVTFANHAASRLTSNQTGLPITSADGVKVALYWSALGSNQFVQAGEAVSVGVPVDGVFADGTRIVGFPWSDDTRVQLRVRAWGGGWATYEEAQAIPGVLIGQSAIFESATGSDTDDPPGAPVPMLASGFQGFALVANDPLRLVCGEDKVAVCDSDWSFDEPTVLGGCEGGYSLSVVGTETNGTCPQVLTRTWLATDSCFCSAVCHQRVTLICPECQMLAITKSCPPHPVPPGGLLNYTGTVSNVSGISFTDVVVFLDQPQPLTLVFGPVALGPGEARSFTGQYAVPVSGGPFVDTLTAKATVQDLAFIDSFTSSCPAASVVTPGDRDGDGVVSPTELSGVLSNFWPHGAPITLTNLTRTEAGAFELALTNVAGWNFSVLTSTNLVDWTPLPVTAQPVFRFSDPEATNIPARAYRLRWP